ncbi:hypothetical protein BD410DRAFT_900296 [Rickenella mellea]|uniref:Uncharacterized protein n=1 Tax=Rickenella mellea TaxID=50990 RepID=A0A4Y7PV20_9AGAM|nr:hypothetical protein BD410DRAFT_900296 [Rickenella mellea]
MKFTSSLAVLSLASLTVCRAISSNSTALEGRDILERTGAETVTCFNVGTKVDSAFAFASIDSFCASIKGQFVAAGTTKSATFTKSGTSTTIFVSGTAINGCSFTVDANCNRLLRLPINNCNIAGANGKQGGFESDACGQWTADPGTNGNRF